MDAEIVRMKPDMEDGVLECGELDLINRALQAPLVEPLQTRPVRPEETARAHIAQAALFQNFVPTDDSVAGNIHIGIGRARYTQSKSRFPARYGAVHPSKLRTPITSDAG